MVLSILLRFFVSFSVTAHKIIFESSMNMFAEHKCHNNDTPTYFHDFKQLITTQSWC